MAAQPLDLAPFAQLKNQMEQITTARKATKTKLDELQKVAVKFMLQMGIRYVDEKGDGTGPFWTLCKDAKEGSWKAERYNEFFAGVLTMIQQGQKLTPEQLTAMAQNYLKQFERKELKIEKHTTARRKDVTDLQAWLAEGAQQ